MDETIKLRPLEGNLAPEPVARGHRRRHRCWPVRRERLRPAHAAHNHRRRVGCPRGVRPRACAGALAGRIRLVVAREYEEIPGGQISIDLPLGPESYRQALARAGITIAPERINLIEPVACGFSVFLDADGRVNGDAWVGGDR